MEAVWHRDLKTSSLTELTYQLLFANGQSDRQHNIDMYTGWKEICKTTGYHDGRTPAREAYEDGYYAPVRGK
jgi:hypothetical protein